MTDESLITPALQERVDVPSEQVTVSITPDAVRRMWRILDRAPDAAPTVVPPAVLVMPDAGREIEPLPGLPEHSLVTGEDWEMRRNLRIGETLTAVNRLAGVAERFGGRLGHTLTVRHEWTFEDATGAVVALTRRSMAYYRREGLRDRDAGPNATGAPPPSDPDAGADPSTAREGDPITGRLLTPSLAQVQEYCDLTGNRTPIFVDREAARAAGLPDTIIPGPLKLALLADAVLVWAGADALLESLRATYRRPDVPGASLLIGGSVTAVEPLEAGRRLQCELWFQNQRGERSVVGAAVVRLPPQ